MVRLVGEQWALGGGVVKDGKRWVRGIVALESLRGVVEGARVANTLEVVEGRGSVGRRTAPSGALENNLLTLARVPAHAHRVRSGRRRRRPSSRRSSSRRHLHPAHSGPSSHSHGARGHGSHTGHVVVHDVYAVGSCSCASQFQPVLEYLWSSVQVSRPLLLYLAGVRASSPLPPPLQAVAFSSPFQLSPSRYLRAGSARTKCSECTAIMAGGLARWRHIPRVDLNSD